jgi:hypothetical protein
MKCVKGESYVVEAGTAGLVPRGVLQVAVRWWVLMNGVVVRVSVLSEGGFGKLNTGVGVKLLFCYKLSPFFRSM